MSVAHLRIEIVNMDGKQKSRVAGLRPPSSVAEMVDTVIPAGWKTKIPRGGIKTVTAGAESRK